MFWISMFFSHGLLKMDQRSCQAKPSTTSSAKTSCRKKISKQKWFLFVMNESATNSCHYYWSKKRRFEMATFFRTYLAKVILLVLLLWTSSGSTNDEIKFKVWTKMFSFIIITIPGLRMFETHCVHLECQKSNLNLNQIQFLLRGPVVLCFENILKLYKCLSHFIEQKGLVFNVDDKSQTVWLNSIDMRLLDFNRLSIFCISIDSSNYGSQSIKWILDYNRF